HRKTTPCRLMHAYIVTVMYVAGDVRQHEVRLAIVAQLDDGDREPKRRLRVHPDEVLPVGLPHRDGDDRLLDADAFREVEIDAQPLRIEGVARSLLACLIIHRPEFVQFFRHGVSPFQNGIASSMSPPPPPSAISSSISSLR